MRAAAWIARRTFAVAVGLGLAVLAASAARGAGPVVAWGAGAFPKIRASAIAQGRTHSCAIQADSGAVVCWGGNVSGEATPPPSVDGTAGTASAIAAGGGHSCAIQAGSGAVVCWGSDGYGQATRPPSVDGTVGTASAIAAGGGHSCAIQAGSGAVVCWGNNHVRIYDEDGRLIGAHTGMSTPPPSVDGSAGTASAIAAGTVHSCAIQTGTGAVVCWGSNYLYDVEEIYDTGKATPPP